MTERKYCKTLFLVRWNGWKWVIADFNTDGWHTVYCLLWSVLFHKSRHKLILNTDSALFRCAKITLVFSNALKITVHFFHRSNPTNPVVFSTANFFEIHSCYDVSKPTVIVIHGYLEQEDSPYMRNITISIWQKWVLTSAFYAMNFHVPHLCILTLWQRVCLAVIFVCVVPSKVSYIIISWITRGTYRTDSLMCSIRRKLEMDIELN